MSNFKFLSYADAIAKANEISNGENLYIAEFRDSSEALKGVFEIPDFSSVLPIWEVCRFNNGEYFEVRRAGDAVMFDNGRVYQIFSVGSGKFGLLPLFPIFGSFHYFKTDAVQPNLIGQATPKKLRDWGDYVDRVLREKAEYKAKNEANNDAQMERAAKRDGAMVEKNGETITRVCFTTGGLRFEVVRGEVGVSIVHRENWDFVSSVRAEIVGEN